MHVIRSPPLQRVSDTLALLFALLAGVAGRGDSDGHCDRLKTPKDTRCTGCPPRHTETGKLCASTTRYNDQTKGACGCGKADIVEEDWWTLTYHTAALNCKNLDPGHPELSWCPAGCGGCYELCTTGGTTTGYPTKSGICRVFKVTNRCGDGYKQYPMWCSNQMTWQDCESNPSQCKEANNTNWFGYSAHFDLQDFHTQISDTLGWDNVEVTFQPVPCSLWQGPVWDCSCSSSAKGATATPGSLPSQQSKPSSPSPTTANANTSEAFPTANPTSTEATPTALATALDTLVRSARKEEPREHELKSDQRLDKGSLPASELTQSPQSSNQCLGAYKQCGGKQWTGPTCCLEGCTCKLNGDGDYQQCIPHGWTENCSAAGRRAVPSTGTPHGAVERVVRRVTNESSTHPPSTPQTTTFPGTAATARDNENPRSDVDTSTQVSSSTTSSPDERKFQEPESAIVFSPSPRDSRHTVSPTRRNTGLSTASTRGALPPLITPSSQDPEGETTTKPLPPVFLASPQGPTHRVVTSSPSSPTTPASAQRTEPGLKTISKPMSSSVGQSKSTQQASLAAKLPGVAEQQSGPGRVITKPSEPLIPPPESAMQFRAGTPQPRSGGKTPVFTSTTRTLDPFWSALKHRIATTTRLMHLPPTQSEAPSASIDLPQPFSVPPPASVEKPGRSNRCRAAYEQCGGHGWAGSTCCEAGCQCKSQLSTPGVLYKCMPGMTTATTCAASIIATAGPTGAAQAVLTAKDLKDTMLKDSIPISSIDPVRQNFLAYQASMAAEIACPVLFAALAIGFWRHAHSCDTRRLQFDTYSEVLTTEDHVRQAGGASA